MGSIVVQTKLRSTAAGLKTMARILHHAQIELDQRGSLNFDTDRVLKRAKASKGSLYHHFGSRHGLIVAAETKQLKAALTTDNEVVRKMIDACKNSNEFIAIVEFVIRAGVGTATVSVRRRIIKSIAHAQHELDLAKDLKTVATDGTIFLAETLSLAQNRKWIKPDIDIMAVAFWLQGLFIGQILNDLANSPTSDEDWIKMTMRSTTEILSV